MKKSTVKRSGTSKTSASQIDPVPKEVDPPPQEPKVYVTLHDLQIIQESIRSFKESSFNVKYLLGSDGGSLNSSSFEEEKAVKHPGKSQTSWKTSSDDAAVETYYYTIYCCGHPLCSPNSLFLHLRKIHGVGSKSVAKKVCKTCHELISEDFLMLHKELVHYESAKGSYEIKFGKVKDDDKTKNYILLVPAEKSELNV